MRDEPSQTAESACLFRAADRQRPVATRILDDAYAELFLGTGTRAALSAFRATGWIGRRAEKRVPGLATFVIARHRQIDEWLVRALDGPIAQVVVLGAGYDTRAYRFAKELRGRPLFELDHPATQRRKRELVAQHARKLPDVDVRHVPIDFAGQRVDERLLSAGFQPGARAFFVWEGVSMYLTRASLKATLHTLRALAGVGSELAMDWWYLIDDPGLLATAHRAGASLLHLLGEPVTLSMHPEDVQSYFEREGYELLERVDAAALESRYVRDERHVYPATYVTLSQTR